MVQAHILYSGTVQGVGFRYTVSRFARNLQVNGWVKNLANGSVEILVEGGKKEIEKLCEAVEQHFSEYVKDKEISFSPAKGEFVSFEITF